MDTYFCKNLYKRIGDKISSAIRSRKNRVKILGILTGGYLFHAGDIIQMSYDQAANAYFFEGICLSIKGKNFGLKSTSFLIRNIFFNVGIEINLSYFVNRVYNLQFKDYRRKHFYYSKFRLYYLREKLNRASRV